MNFTPYQTSEKLDLRILNMSIVFTSVVFLGYSMMNTLIITIYLPVFRKGCNVVISSRKVERLEAAAEELKQKIPASSLASVVPIVCNIRQEDEVHTILAFRPTSMVSIGIHLL